MKKLLTLIVMVMLGLSLMAQSTGKISYQAVVRDGNNRLVTNKPVSVAVTITYGTDTYNETVSTTTNANGLASLQIGGASGFDAIDWSNATITTAVTIDGGETVTNTVPVTATPYAIQATYSADVSPTGATVQAIYNKIQADSILMQTNIDTTSQHVRAALVDTAANIRALLDSLTNRIAELEGRHQFECGTSKVEDADGNRYATVVIGTQCWMKENLRTTKYADGTSIPLGTSTSTTTAYRYAPGPNQSNEENMVNVPRYGYLYNWPAVMHGASSSDANPSGVQGICPTGWHVPSDAEWTELTNYMKTQPAYRASGNADHLAKALAATWGWHSSSATDAPGNDPTTNNATGFSALPAGFRGLGYYHDFGVYAGLWSATEYRSTDAYGRYLYFDNASVNRVDFYRKDYGFSVRCLRD